MATSVLGWVAGFWQCGHDAFSFQCIYFVVSRVAGLLRGLGGAETELLGHWRPAGRVCEC